MDTGSRCRLPKQFREALRHPYDFLTAFPLLSAVKKALPVLGAWSPAEHGARSIEVVVLFTTHDQTRRAVKFAEELTQGITARIRLLGLQVVPYPLSANEPDVSLKFMRQRMLSAALGTKLDLEIELRLGRDKAEMLDSALKRGSMVVIGGAKGFGLNWRSRLARRLKRLGHHPIFAG